MGQHHRRRWHLFAALCQLDYIQTINSPTDNRRGFVYRGLIYCISEVVQFGKEWCCGMYLSLCGCQVLDDLRAARASFTAEDVIRFYDGTEYKLFPVFAEIMAKRVG